MRRILLMGYFGAGNFGDDALLADWLLAHGAWLDEQRLACDVLSRSSAPLESFSEGAQLARHIGNCLNNRQALAVPLSGYAALVAPGGSLLQDSTSWRSLAYYLLLISRFLQARKPVYLLHQGIGPISTWLGSFATAHLLKYCTLLSVRDEQSLAWAEGQPALSRQSNLLLSADPILGASFAAGSGRLPGKPYALIIPRSTGDLPHRGDPTTEAQALATACRSLQQCGLQPVLLALHAGQDAELCSQITTIYPEAISLQPQAPAGNHIWSLIGGAALVVSYRLHGLVAAASQGVPGFGIAYDPKVSSFCAELDQPWCFPAQVHLPESLELLEQCGTDLETAGAILAQRRPVLLRRLAICRGRFAEAWPAFS